MDLENVRVAKGVRNKVNRLVNCETANMNKAIDAALRQVEMIEPSKRTAISINCPAPFSRWRI